MSTKHTPGPWGVFTHPAHGYAISRANEYGNETSDHVAVAFFADSPKRRDECAANARLIAAAPELLAALEACLYVMRATGNDKGGSYEAGMRAITKATGEAA